MANLPTTERFPNIIAIFMKNADFDSQMMFISKKKLLGIFFLSHEQWHTHKHTHWNYLNISFQSIKLQ